MSLRQMFAGSIVKPGLNPLVAPTPTYLYNLYSWGGNNYGQLGLGNTTSYSSPKQIGSPQIWSTISSFGKTIHFLALKSDGTLWSWGQNNYGQLGLGNRTSYSSPKQVGALTNWLKISAGYYNSFAIKTNGTLWAWGGDVQSWGILGLGNITAYSSPKQVGSLTNWSAVASGFRVSIASKTDGTLWVWGNNYFGTLGLNSSSGYSISSPVQVGSLTNWLKVSSGYGSVFSIKTDGTLWAWGYNSAASGVLGLNSAAYKFISPNQVGSLTTWANITTGSSSPGFSLATKTDGTLWGWGNGSQGNLGLGNTNNYSSPKQIGALTTWSVVSAGPFTSFAVKTDGTLWSWGKNDFGQLGLGNTTYYSSPKQIGSIATWFSIASSSNAAIGIG